MAKPGLDFLHDEATLGGDFGVGIVIRGQGIDEELRVNVKDIVAHGSADRDGRVTPGDNILAIQGINVLQLGSLEVCRKHLKGPSGTSVRIDIGKASGETLSVTLERGNAGYWALYDTLHKANLDIVSLKRELADAQLAVKKASDDADDVRKLSVDAEEKTRTAINLKREFETRCENLKSQTEELLETIQQQDVKIYAANTAKRLAEADKDHAVIEAKDLTDQLEVEKRRAMKACERAVQCEKDLVDETDQKLALSKEVQRLKMLCRDVEDRIRHEAAADLASMRSRAEQAEAAVLRLEREMASRQSVIEGLHADLTGARTSEATLTERLSVSEADRSRCMHELEVKAAQVESVTRASTEANAASEQAQAEARMHKLATKSLQERVVSLERECMDDKAKVADMLVRVNNLQQEKIEIEHLLQDTSKVAAAYVTDIATLRDTLREQKSQVSKLEMAIRDYEPQLAVVPPIKAKVLAVASENRDLRDQVDELKTESTRVMLAERRVREELTLAMTKIEEVQAQKNSLQLEAAGKLADMEKRINEDVYFLTHERDHYKAELNRYYALPNPCGVGMQVEETTENLPTGGTISSRFVKALLPGMSADLAGCIRPSDLILAVDNIPTLGMTLDDMRDAIAGPRGSKVTIRFLREKTRDKTLATEDGSQFTVVLKRGAWGPEHAVCVPEDMDMIDHGRWPELKAVSTSDFKMESINRHLIKATREQV